MCRVRVDSIGNRAAVPAKYAPRARSRKGNTVVPCIFETFGGFEGSVVHLLNDLSKAARAKTPPGQEPPWSARNFVPYWSQLLSREVRSWGSAESSPASTRKRRRSSPVTATAPA